MMGRTGTKLLICRSSTLRSAVDHDRPPRLSTPARRRAACPICHRASCRAASACWRVLKSGSVIADHVQVQYCSENNIGLSGLLFRPRSRWPGPRPNSDAIGSKSRSIPYNQTRRHYETEPASLVPHAVKNLAAESPTFLQQNGATGCRTGPSRLVELCGRPQ